MAFSPEEEEIIAEFESDLQKEAGPYLRKIASASPMDHRLLVAAVIRLYGPLDWDPDKTPPARPLPDFSSLLNEQED